MRGKWVGLTLLAAGAALVIGGLALGQEIGVFRKAIFICLECIGIG